MKKKTELKSRKTTTTDLIAMTTEAAEVPSTF
jgi:hypothetical protein